MKLTDSDGIDGPFDRAMDRAMREDRGLAEHLKSCDCGGCREFDAKRFDQMRSVVGYSASDFKVLLVTADTITDEQIREMCDTPRVSGAPAGEDRRLDELFDHALGSNGREACIDRGYSITPHMREQARARCAEILNARRSA